MYSIARHHYRSVSYLLAILLCLWILNMALSLYVVVVWVGDYCWIGWTSYSTSEVCPLASL